MARGFVWSLYVADNGDEFATKIDADYAVAVERGWVPSDPTITPQLPRSFLMRAVFGYDESGRQQHAIVASVDAPLWTGQVEVFTVTANDASNQAVNVIGRTRERRVPRGFG